MKKQYLLLLLCTFSVFGTIIPAYHQPDSKKYNVARTRELQEVVDQITYQTQNVLASRVISLVSANANPNLRLYGCSASLLEWYVRYGNQPVVALLLTHNADPNTKDSEGETPLFAAEHPAIVKLLLDAGAELHHCSRFKNNSILHQQVALGTFNNHSPHVLALLCQAGLDVNGLNRAKETPIIQLNYLIPFFPAERESEMMKRFGVLCSYGANFGVKDSNGNSPLDELKKKNPLSAARLHFFLEALSSRRENARNALGAWLSSFFRHERAGEIGYLISCYSGAPGLQLPMDIDEWDELLLPAQTDKAKKRTSKVPDVVYLKNAYKQTQSLIKQYAGVRKRNRLNSGPQY